MNAATERSAASRTRHASALHLVEGRSGRRHGNCGPRRSGSRACGNSSIWVLPFLLALALVVPPVCLAADDGSNRQGLLPVPDYGGDVWSRTHLAGDPAGYRSELADWGVQADVRLVQIVGSVTDGGTQTSTRYGGTADYNLSIDLMRMGLIPGGLLVVKGESRYGKTINGLTNSILPANIDGVLPASSEVDDDIGFTLTNLAYFQFLSESFSVFFGKVDTLSGEGNEFAGGGRGTQRFMNYNFLTNASASYPLGYSVVGGGFSFSPSERLAINSSLLTMQDSSRSTGLNNFDDGLTWSTEVYTQYRLGDLPGGVMLGFLYSFDADFPREGGYLVPGLIVAPSSDETWSVSFNGWQYLYVEDPDNASAIDVTDGRADRQGLGLFARVGFADEDTNIAQFTVSGGVGGRGLIPGRDDDSFGLGYYYINNEETQLGGTLGARDYSQGFEAFYDVQMTPASALTFDLQVVDGALRGADPAIVLSSRWNLRF